MNCNSNTAPIPEIITASCNEICNIKDINVVCKKIIIPQGQETLAIEGENNFAKRTFLVPKINENNEDLSDKSFSIIIKNSNNEIITRDIKNPTMLENYIGLDLEINSEITSVSGKVIIAIQATSEENNYVWKTYPATFNIAKSM